MLTALLHEDCDYSCEREVFWQLVFRGFWTKMIGLILACNLWNLQPACGFLRCGQTITCLRLRGTTPDERERFMIFDIVGNSEPTTSFNSLVGIMSCSHVEFLAAFITLSISSVNSSKVGNVSSHWAQPWFSTSMVGDFASFFCLFFFYFSCQVRAECLC